MSPYFKHITCWHKPPKHWIVSEACAVIRQTNPSLAEFINKIKQIHLQFLCLSEFILFLNLSSSTNSSICFACWAHAIVLINDEYKIYCSASHSWIILTSVEFVFSIYSTYINCNHTNDIKIKGNPLLYIFSGKVLTIS